MTFRIAPAKHKGIAIMEEKETMGAAVVDEISIKIGPIRVRFFASLIGNGLGGTQNRACSLERKIRRKVATVLRFATCGAVKLNLL